MEVAQIIVNIVLIVCAIALIAVVLMQQTKSSGLGSAFGGETQAFTARGRAASREAKLQKLTIIFASIIGVLAIVMMILS